MFIALQKKYYTYTHAYPLEMGGHVFYVGKGTGDRILEHEIEARNDGRSRKCQVIREIWARGYQVQKEIIFETDIEQEAFIYEWACITMIYASPWLTNTLANVYAHELSDFEQELKAEKASQAFLLAQSRGFKKERKPIELIDPGAKEDKEPWEYYAPHPIRKKKI